MEIAITCSDIDRLKYWLHICGGNQINNNAACCIDYGALFRIIDNNPISYIYYGNSFCQYRLPDLQSIKDAIRYCDDNNIKFVLLTPPLSEYGLNICRKYLEYFISINRLIEVVINDLGLIELIEELHYEGNLIWGRVMDKTIHDSRITIYEEKEYYSESGYLYMHSLSTEAVAFKSFLLENQISRVDYDGNSALLPSDSIIKYDYIYPTEYLTTGRNCLFKIAGQSRENKFVINDSCAYLCKNAIEVMVKQIPYVKLDDNCTRIRESIMLRNGNTLFNIHNRLCAENVINRLILDIDNVF